MDEPAPSKLDELGPQELPSTPEIIKDSQQTLEVEPADEELSECDSLHHYNHPAEEYYEWYYEEDEEELKEEVASLLQEGKEASAVAEEEKPWPWNVDGFLRCLTPAAAESLPQDKSVAAGVVPLGEEDGAGEEQKEDTLTVDMIQPDWRTHLERYHVTQKATRLASKALGETEEQIRIRRVHLRNGTGQQEHRLFFEFWRKCVIEAGGQDVRSWDEYEKARKKLVDEFEQGEDGVYRRK